MQLALNKDTGQKVAIKFLELDEELSGPAVMAELLTQRRCRQHPHIVQLQVRLRQRSSVYVQLERHETICMGSTANNCTTMPRLSKVQTWVSDGAGS